MRLFKKNRHEKSTYITGITGQDGSYLAELLLSKATRCMELFGATPLSIRNVLIICTRTLTLMQLFLPYGDIADSTNLIQVS